MAVLMYGLMNIHMLRAPYIFGLTATVLAPIVSVMNASLNVVLVLMVLVALVAIAL